MKEVKEFDVLQLDVACDSVWCIVCLSALLVYNGQIEAQGYKGT